MAYITVPESVLAVDDPIRSTDIIQLDRNIEDLNARVSSVEPGGFYSHFTDNNFAAATQPFQREGIFCFASGAGTVDPRIDNAILTHNVRLTTPAAGYIQCAGVPMFDFSVRTKPLTFSTRIQYDTRANIASLRVGWVGPALPTTARPTDGVYMELNAGNFRFTSSNGGANTAGTDFAWIANSTYFDVDIIFTDAGGNRALCYVNAVLKETITLNLPIAKRLYGCVNFEAIGGVAVAVDVDMIQGKAGGGVVDQL
jgi:hypothetical protein